ncbi:MAG: PQQ-binding-like beta-propeller repeat protein [Tunicatimonas sp.]|uniref:outer membrane protein assembly factor BamB family protein n=1 Tax=Tunicatimonas sp. TaxID=1940096 RepID=UPI003C78313A
MLYCSVLKKLLFIRYSLCVAFLSACHQPGWVATIDESGTYSSPRVCDLTEDGVKDIVLGAGGSKEWEPSENAVVAIDGQHGKLLWKVPGRNQIVGSPVFLDVTNDGISDVFIGGRSAQFFAIDGSSGDLLWEYERIDPYRSKADTTVLNFFTPQIIPDCNQDGLSDLLVSYGGFVNARPWEDQRPVGYLMIFSSADGEVLAKAPMPDGKETYMSPIVSEDAVYFGTGGETIAGNFYRTPISDLLDGKIDEAISLLAGKEKGFIAPPLLTDLTGDEVLDVVINAYEGKTIALNGEDHTVLWEVSPGEGYETHAQPAIGQFVGDPTPDFFVNYGEGTWPEISRSLQVLIDGKTGEYNVLDSLGSLQYASPVTITTANRNFEEVLLPVNVFTETGYARESGYPAKALRVQLRRFDFTSGTNEVFYEVSGSNLGATVLLEDLDADGTSEIVFVRNHNPYSLFEHTGLSIHCLPATDYHPTRSSIREKTMSVLL